MPYYMLASGVVELLVRSRTFTVDELDQLLEEIGVFFPTPGEDGNTTIAAMVRQSPGSVACFAPQSPLLWSPRGHTHTFYPASCDDSHACYQSCINCLRTSCFSLCPSRNNKEWLPTTVLRRDKSSARDLGEGCRTQLWRLGVLIQDLANRSSSNSPH